MAYEFRWKDTRNWGSASIDPTTAFRAGFNFKSTTVIELDCHAVGPRGQARPSAAEAAGGRPAEYKAEFMASGTTPTPAATPSGLTFAGEKMTAVGGFVFDPSGNGRPDITVRIFSAPSSGNRCNPSYAYGSSNYVASVQTGSDGFYFIWQKDVDNTGVSTGTNTLPSGFKYYVALCDFTVGGTAMPFAQLYWPARSMNNSLGNKEFDEEDFFVSGPTRLEYQSQSITGKINKTLGTVKVALLDGFGNVMTVDTARPSVTPDRGSGPGTSARKPTTTKSLAASRRGPT